MHNNLHLFVTPFPPSCPSSPIGDNDTVTTTVYNNTAVNLYFRGNRNLRAIVDDLVANHGLGSATALALTGDSAGGLAVYLHSHYLAATLPKATVVSVPDSGFFFSWAQYPAWPQALAWVLTYGGSTHQPKGTLHPLVLSSIGDFVLCALILWSLLVGAGDPGNGTGSLNPACVEVHGIDCRMPEVAATFLSMPVFAVNSKVGAPFCRCFCVLPSSVSLLRHSCRCPPPPRPWWMLPCASQFDPALDAIVAGEGGGNVSHVTAIGEALVETLTGALGISGKYSGEATARSDAGLHNVFLRAVLFIAYPHLCLSLSQALLAALDSTRTTLPS
jgi:hypothetical protein